MATGKRKGHGIKNHTISDCAGIEPFKLDCAFTNAAGAHAEFLAAKSASGVNSASAEEGDFYYDSTNNVFRFYTGAAWASMTGGLGSALTTGKMWLGAAGVAAEGIDLTGTAGDIIVSNGTTGAVVAVTGDMSLSGAGLALLSDKYGERTVTSLATAGAGTYTAAHLLGGLIVRDCAGAGRTDTTSTAALLVTALGVAAEVGSFVDCIVVNDSDADEAITLAGGVGCTLDVTSGAGGARGTLSDAVIPYGQYARLLFVFSNVTAAAEACAVYCIGRGPVSRSDNKVGSDAAGDIHYKSSANATARLAKGTAKQVLTMNAGATAPEWSDGPVIRSTTVDIAAADVKTLNATPVVLVDHSALVTAGICAAGDALIFQGAVINEYGGTTDYDQDGDCVVEYTTGPVVVSLTLDDFFNDGTAGSIATIKPLATDLAYNQVIVNDDLELKMTASPFNAAGNRLARVTTYYSVFTPHA